MPWWLIYYANSYFDVTVFFFLLSFISLFIAFWSFININKMTWHAWFFVSIAIVLFSVAILLPNGRTAISIYNNMI